MSLSIGRRQISAIARLDLSGLSHAQRLEAIAGPLGFRNAAAMMAALKNEEATPSPHPEPSRPVRAVVAFGQMMCSVMGGWESPYDSNGDLPDGDLDIVAFDTVAELRAYAKGIADAEGWMDATFLLCEEDEPDDPFFRALNAVPDLSYAAWREAEIRAEDAEENDPRPDDPTPIAGYQVDDPETGENWGGRPSFEILTRETALIDLAHAIQSGKHGYRFLIVREGDIEAPSFERPPGS